MLFCARQEAGCRLHAVTQSHRENRNTVMIIDFAARSEASASWSDSRWSPASQQLKQHRGWNYGRLTRKEFGRLAGAPVVFASLPRSLRPSLGGLPRGAGWAGKAGQHARLEPLASRRADRRARSNSRRHQKTLHQPPLATTPDTGNCV